MKPCGFSSMRNPPEECPNGYAGYQSGIFFISKHKYEVTIIITNSMAYGTRRFNAAFTRALQ